jgi:hypothetical protein
VITVTEGLKIAILEYNRTELTPDLHISLPESVVGYLSQKFKVPITEMGGTRWIKLKSEEIPIFIDEEEFEDD